MYRLKSEIYEKYFLKILHTDDPNKDVNNKGTLQRMVETLAEDWDNTVIDTIFTLLDSTLIPATVKNKFIPYLENQLGVLTSIHPSLVIRREILKRLLDIRRHKGTLHSYKLIFSALGFDGVEITNMGGGYGFDSPNNLDSRLRTFDLGKCTKCRYYTLNLIGSVVIDDDMYDAIIKALQVVEPIYAKLYAISKNSVELDLIVIFVDDNGDLIYSSRGDTTDFLLESNGDIIVYGDSFDRYSIDTNGNLIYNE